MKTTKANLERGLTKIEILVVVAVLALPAAVYLLAAEVTDRHRLQINCVNNIRQIQLAFKTWPAGCDDRMPMQTPVAQGGTMEWITNGLAYIHFQMTSNELSAPKLLVCPADKSRTAAKSFAKQDFSNANVSYFIGVDATDSDPAMILLGDRNLTLDGAAVKPGLISPATNSAMGWTKEMHVEQGNIGLADGSVMQVSAKRLSDAMQGNGTNRWEIP